MPETRLGDIIDDHCTKCRMLTNHSIMAIVNGEAAKVQCRTCYHEHNFRHGMGCTDTQSTEKSDLFDEVLLKVKGGDPSLDSPSE